MSYRCTYNICVEVNEEHTRINESTPSQKGVPDKEMLLEIPSSEAASAAGTAAASSSASLAPSSSASTDASRQVSPRQLQDLRQILSPVVAGKPVRALESEVLILLQKEDLTDAANALAENGWWSLKRLGKMRDIDVDKDAP